MGIYGTMETYSATDMGVGSVPYVARWAARPARHWVIVMGTRHLVTTAGGQEGSLEVFKTPLIHHQRSKGSSETRCSRAPDPGLDPDLPHGETDRRSRWSWDRSRERDAWITGPSSGVTWPVAAAAPLRPGKSRPAADGMEVRVGGGSVPAEGM
ncbi:unnamed protein product [Arctogadus glacialis]